jgi:hypothetical protein
MRSPVAYATSFKCPARLYDGSEEPFFRDDTGRTALLAKARGLEVEVVVIPGDHQTAVPAEVKQAIEFFRQNE